MEISVDGGRGSTVEPPGMENPGVSGQTGKKKTSVGGIDISWNHSLSVLNVLLYKFLIQKGNRRELVHLSSVLLIIFCILSL